jgi:hypothetical protein
MSKIATTKKSGESVKSSSGFATICDSHRSVIRAITQPMPGCDAAPEPVVHKSLGSLELHISNLQNSVATLYDRLGPHVLSIANPSLAGDEESGGSSLPGLAERIFQDAKLLEGINNRLQEILQRLEI